MQYLKDNRFKILALALMGLLAALGFDAAAMFGGALLIGDVEPANVKELYGEMQKAFDKLQVGIKKSQDVADAAIDQIKRGDNLHAETATKLKALGEGNTALQEEFKSKMNEYGDRMRELEQKLDKRPSGREQFEQKTAGYQFIESDIYKGLMQATKGGTSKNGWDSQIFDVNRKAAILSAVTLTNDQPLVAPMRLPGVISPGLRRFTIRDLLPNLRTSSNFIEYARELLFTSNAAPQYDSSSPDPTREGALKNESALTFELVNSAVITIAHYIPASRQILRDAPMLQGYIDSRLTYGLKLEEEDELLNGAGTNGKLSGLRASGNFTAFSGGATNQTAIDTLLKAMTQVQLSYFEPSGFVLHPIDWQNILLLKDTQGRYLFGDPHNFTAPAIWGKPVVPTQAITQGQFLAGAFDLCAAIFDAEDVSIRVAEQHSDWFARNLIAILCEERLALAIYRPASIVGGAISYAG